MLVGCGSGDITANAFTVKRVDFCKQLALNLACPSFSEKAKKVFSWF
jgi:hypothetical protein